MEGRTHREGGASGGESGASEAVSVAAVQEIPKSARKLDNPSSLEPPIGGGEDHEDEDGEDDDEDAGSLEDGKTNIPHGRGQAGALVRNDSTGNLRRHLRRDEALAPTNAVDG